MSCIALINYGSGNYTSVANALRRLNIDFQEACSPQDLKDATHIILPGVGAFAAAIRRLQEQKLDTAIVAQVTQDKKPFLGICVGMQVLADLGREHEDCKGLGLIPGVVDRIDTNASKLPLPHMGWNELEGPCDDPLLTGCGAPPTFYFVHSYALTPQDQSCVVANADYGVPVTAMVRRGNIWGVQFHPEKSQQDGLRLLTNFAALPGGDA